MISANKPFGLVLTGGKSSRMGEDKSMIIYHRIPQRYHIYELLKEICEATFISCNPSQLNGMWPGYQTMADLPQYENTGPVAAVLTAFDRYPGQDLLIIGCDYPLISKSDLIDFSSLWKEGNPAAAFYNREADLYDPMLAWYSAGAAAPIKELFEKKLYSLQHFLKANNAARFYPRDTQVMASIDTPDTMTTIKNLISK